MVNFRVGRIVELLWHDRIRQFFDQFLRPIDGTPHTTLGRCQFQLRTEKQQHTPALHRHRFEHGQNQTITFRRRHERQRDSRIPRRRLNQHGFIGDPAFTLQGLNYGEADVVLDRA